MLKDSSYLVSEFKVSEKSQTYGSNVHILESPYHQHLLSHFSTAQSVQPDLNQITRKLTSFLCQQAVNLMFKQETQKVKTRMSAFHPAEAEFEALKFSAETKAVVVDLIRAGILPSEVCYEFLHDILPAKNIRQDHILLNRAVNKKQEVVGAELSGFKIGGSIKNAFVLIPDPMGATGSTIKSVIELYQKREKSGSAKRFIALHFIVTPEYLSAMKDFKDCLEIFALRLDRGLSPKEVLKKPLGRDWKKEKGLNEKDYIVPGAGGIGELLNNAFES